MSIRLALAGKPELRQDHDVQRPDRRDAVSATGRALPWKKRAAGKRTKGDPHHRPAGYLLAFAVYAGGSGRARLLVGEKPDAIMDLVDAST